ncbi:MAG: leucyl aminopeptidase [Nitrospirae bacterium]|nr:MAG: leucyl aminopeptidase [Nitrospirota bacterium]
MEFKILKKDILKTTYDAVVVGTFEDQPISGHLLEIDRAMDGALKAIMEEEGFKGKENSVLLIHTLNKIAPKRIIIAGLGKREEFNTEKVRRAAANGIKKAEDVKAKNIAALPFFYEHISREEVIQAMVEGMGLMTYKFDKHKEKKEEEKREIDTVEFITEDGDALKDALDRGLIITEAVNFVRDIVNEPANIITPKRLSEIALELSEKNKELLSCKVYGVDEIKKMGMGAFEAVAKGSDNPACFIHILYKPYNKTPKKKVAIVGKGLTFDSGGLNIKTGQHMRFMKTDKAGACAVLGVMSALPKLNIDVEVHGIIAAVENMPSGRAMKPDDIVTAKNGKTIEISNTDAEGRLTLADALCYTVEQKVDRIIDLATLTGACIIALGDYTVGVMGNNQDFIDEILKVSEAAGEHMWQLPFYDQMRDKIKSDVADLNNTGGRYGGAITAGMFLEHFVNSTPWVHMDIAGPAFNEKGWSYNPKGATGVGVRTLIRYLLR